jgi:hypothetical protein
MKELCATGKFMCLQRYGVLLLAVHEVCLGLGGGGVHCGAFHHCRASNMEESAQLLHLLHLGNMTTGLLKARGIKLVSCA